MAKAKRKKRGGATFQCPYCKNRTSVLVTRRDSDGTIVRVRECKRCHKRVDTAETMIRKYDRPKKPSRPSKARELSPSI